MAAKKKVTLAEFHAWLEGVEEMHADDWCPDANQWKVIRNKIKTIIDAPTQSPIPTSQTLNPQRPVHAAPAGFTPAPEAPSSIPLGPVVKPDPAANQMLAGDGTGKTVTPTSATGDASPFS